MSNKRLPFPMPMLTLMRIYYRNFFFTEKVLSRNLIFVGKCKGSNLEVRILVSWMFVLGKQINIFTQQIAGPLQIKTKLRSTLTVFTETYKFRGKP